MPKRRSVLSTIVKWCHDPVYGSRLRELVRCMIPHVREGDRVLDVGCGRGALRQALLSHPHCPPGVHIDGLERKECVHRLREEQRYAGMAFPHEDRTFDIVILADVLHHDAEPERLLRECIRISKRLVIIKDHQVEGLFAQARLALLDWVANLPYGVPCLYRYLTPLQWKQLWQRHTLVLEHEMTSMRLYPSGLNLIFGGRLHYFAVLRVPSEKSVTAGLGTQSVSASHGSDRW